MTKTVSLLLLLVLAAAASGANVSFSFNGVVDAVIQSPPEPFSSVRAGDPIEVNYTLNVDSPDLEPLEDFGTYSGSLVAYDVNIGGVSVNTTSGGVNTTNKHSLAPKDVYAAIGLFDGYSTSVSFQDASGLAIEPSDNLSTIDLAEFGERSFLLLNGQFPSITGTLNAVPEGNYLALPVLLLAAYFGHLRKRRL